MPGVCHVTLRFVTRHRLFGGGTDPASECFDRGVAQAILANDELIVVVSQFRSGKGTYEAACRDIGLNQGQRSQRDAEAIDGGLKLKIGVVEFKVPNRREAWRARG